MPALSANQIVPTKKHHGMRTARLVKIPIMSALTACGRASKHTMIVSKIARHLRL
jgi:hypothetical protein